jgi:hypothetical protein
VTADVCIRTQKLSRELWTLSMCQGFVGNKLGVRRAFVDTAIAMPDAAVDLGHPPVSTRSRQHSRDFVRRLSALNVLET